MKAQCDECGKVVEGVVPSRRNGDFLMLCRDCQPGCDIPEPNDQKLK